MNEVSGSPSDPATTDAAELLVDAEAGARAVPAPGTSSIPRTGVPVWRVGKPDTFLAADVATARTAIGTIASDSDIGKHVGVRSEGVRCVSHLFESTKPGYHGWVWFATLARVSRGKTSTVNEVGLLPTDDAVLAPAWLPWAERVRPEDAEEATEAPAVHAQDEMPDDAAPVADAAESDVDVTDVTGQENL